MQLAKTTTTKPSELWTPQQRQRDLLTAAGLLDAWNGGKAEQPMCERIGYGGAAFGGKTEGLIGLGMVACMRIPGVQIGFFRRTFPELEGSDGPIFRSRNLYPSAGGRYNDQKHVWKFPKKAEFHFCHCQHEKDVFAYQSQAFDILMIDEATHFSWFIVDYLLTRNRISKYSEIPRPFSIFTTNPGGIGHMWFMQLFGIDPAGYYENQADH